MTRIGIVTTDPAFFTGADPERDSAPLVAALRERGVQADAVVWRGTAAGSAEDLTAFDLLVLRSPWDYALHPAEFDAWLERAETSTRVLNEPDLVRWNMDKRYLAQLEAAGIAVVPTAYCADEASVRAALAEAADGSHVVLKPTVGAGSQHAGLHAADDPAALELARTILATGCEVMVQPEVPELSAGEEKAVYTLDGSFTHAIAKGALLARGGGLRGGVYREAPQAVVATDAERDFAERVLTAVTAATGLPTPLYGRIDLVDTAEHGLVLLEAELFEPTFNLHLAPEVVELFTEAILARARQGGPRLTAP
ncbi:hypothetical protein [Brachybacterium sp.]|uniref:ATP-grasp domain-containing protein n=1 Tax=Brachybacterium sp. TaxID=1891286 RepID=UPI002ED4CC0A